MSFGAAFSRALLGTAQRTGAALDQRRRDEEERQRAAALMQFQREQFEAQQAALRQAQQRQQALDQREFTEGGYTAVNPLQNASGRAMDAIPLPSMQRLAGLSETQGPAARGFATAFTYGGQEFAKTGPSLREQEQQAARTERLTARSEDRRARDAELAADRERRATEQAALFAQQEKMARLSASLAAGNRPPPQPQLIPGNDGFMYRYEGGRMVRVPVDGMTAPAGGDAPRTQAVPVRPAPGDTLLQGLGISRPAPERSMGGAAQAPAMASGPFGRTPSAGAAPKISSEAQKRLEFANVAIDAVNRYAQTLDQVGPSIVAGNDPGANRLKSEYTNLLLTLKEAQNLGVLNGKDLEVLEGLLTPPVSMRGALWRGEDGLRAQVDAVRDQLTTRRSLIKQQYGVPLSLEDEFPAQTARIAEARADGYSDDEIRAFLSGGRR